MEDKLLDLLLDKWIKSNNRWAEWATKPLGDDPYYEGKCAGIGMAIRDIRELVSYLRGEPNCLDQIYLDLLNNSESLESE